MTPQGRAFTFNKKLWSIFLMKATLSAKLLLIAGIAIQSNAVNAQTEKNNNTTESTEPVSATQPVTTNSENELVDSTINVDESTQDEFIEQNSALEQELSEEGTLEKLEQENAALDEILEQSEDLTAPVMEEQSQTDTIVDTEVLATEPPESPEETISEEVIADESAEATDEAVTVDESAEVTDETVTVEDNVEEPVEVIVEENSAIDEVMSDLNEVEDNTETDQTSEQSSVAPYNFERSASGEAATFIPLMADAKVFAEFVDRLPAVVNYFTMASEDEVISFYNENFGEPIGQERKRERLTVSYYTDGIATRVVISQQDDYRQVDVLQEESN